MRLGWEPGLMGMLLQHIKVSETSGTFSHGQSKIQYPLWKWAPSCHFLSGSAVGRNVGFLLWQLEKVMGAEPRSPRSGCGTFMTEEPRYLHFYPGACRGSQVFSHSLRQNHACSMQIGPRELQESTRCAVIQIAEKPQSPASLLTDGFRERPVCLFRLS